MIDLAFFMIEFQTGFHKESTGCYYRFGRQALPL